MNERTIEEEKKLIEDVIADVKSDTNISVKSIMEKHKISVSKYYKIISGLNLKKKHASRDVLKNVNFKEALDVVELLSDKTNENGSPVAEVIKDIKSNTLSMKYIMDKHKINSYEYYKIVELSGIKKDKSTIRIKKCNDINTSIVDIVKDIESDTMTVKEILEKYNISTHIYRKILEVSGLKKKKVSKLIKKIRFTGDLIQPTSSSSTTSSVSESTLNSLDVDIFKLDCEAGMKMSDLMVKHKLSLYEVRELRKIHGFKTR